MNNMVGPEKHESGGSSEVGGGASSSVPSGGGGMDELISGKSGGGGNRWPKQETMALLRIRSEMDVAFRDANLKGPLWDEISRKMGELGFARSAKKCKEKFENVYKYHKRTKDGRTSKPDGKTYRFFDQLKALENNTSFAPPPQLLPPPTTTASPHSIINIPMPSHVNIPSTTPTPSNLSIPQTTNNIPINSFPSYQASQQPPMIQLPQTQTTFQHSHHISHMSTGFLSNSTSSSSTSSDEDVQMQKGKKRKWKDFFGKLMNDVMQKQEELQKKFLDTLEKRERDRISREEAWRVHEMAKMNREHELLVKERSMASARDAAVIAFLQKVSEEQHNLQNPNSNNINKVASPPPPPPLPPPQSTTPPQVTISTPQVALPTQTNTMVVSVNDNESAYASASSSRWPKEEIEALINIRTGLEFKYQDNVPKGPLWEEISSAMGKLGYTRNSKRCKEKWENINKYYKKVKESNKKRPQDSKTCPYFNKLEAVYNDKAKTSCNVYLPKPENQLPIMAQPEQQWPLLPPQQHNDSTMQVHDHDMESDNNDIEDEEDEYEEEEQEEAERYEIVTNKHQPICSVTNAVE